MADSDDFFFKANLERNKLLFETLKHLTTLNAGALVLMAGMHPSLSPFGRILLGMGFVSLAISMVATLTEMLSMWACFDEMIEESKDAAGRNCLTKREEMWLTAGLIVSFFFFVVGIVVIASAAAFCRLVP